MEDTKIGKKLMALVLVLATMVAFAATAFAYDVNSAERYIDGRYNGVNFQYKILSTLYVDSSRSYRGSIWVSIPSQTYVPAGWMEVMAEVLDYNTGKVVKSTAMEENTRSTYYMYAVTETYNTSNPVCSRGRYRVYDGTQNRTGFAYETEPVPGTRAISKSLLSTLEANGSYPKTKAGETYGSVLLADVVGYEPDLISALGLNGISGYVRNEDVYPTFITRAEYETYINTLEANEWKIPLYDLQGNVIGAYEISKGQTIPESSDFSYEEARACIEGRGSSVASEDLKLSYEEARDYVAREDSSTESADRTVSKGEVEVAFSNLCKKWLVNGEYQQTTDGKTYGPSTLYEIVGKEPDLILVEGDNGKDGFVTLEDYDPLYYCKTPEDVNEYFKTHPSNGDRTVPVYDLEGNVIDKFTFRTGEVGMG